MENRTPSACCSAARVSVSFDMPENTFLVAVTAASNASSIPAAMAGFTHRSM